MAKVNSFLSLTCVFAGVCAGNLKKIHQAHHNLRHKAARGPHDYNLKIQNNRVRNIDETRLEMFQYNMSNTE